LARTARKHAGGDRLGDHLRLCAVTRAELPVTDLIRFVAGPDGAITPDLARKLPGRGVWLTADRQTVAAAVKNRAFARSLKQPVNAPADLPAVVEDLLAKRAVEALAMANKAGHAISGFDKVWETIEKGRAALLVHGSDAAADGRDRLTRKFQAVQAATGRTATVVTELAIEQLSLAMGRSNVVHAALIHGGVTDRFTGEAARLSRYRSGLNSSVCTQPPADMRGDTPAPSNEIETDIA
jgi:predicted RNA-binding protein YlxR (DUF448 family)